MSATAKHTGCPECGTIGGHSRDCSRLNAGAEVERLRARVAELDAEVARWLEWSEKRGPGLDAYREMGRRLAATENERDEARAEVKAIAATLTETSVALSAMRRERDALDERLGVAEINWDNSASDARALRLQLDEVTHHRDLLETSEVEAKIERDAIRERMEVAVSRFHVASTAAIRALPDEDADARHVQPFDPWEDGEEEDVSPIVCTACGRPDGHEDWCSLKAALDSLDANTVMEHTVAALDVFEDAPGSHQEPRDEEETPECEHCGEYGTRPHAPWCPGADENAP